MLNAARRALVEVRAITAADPLPPFVARMSGNLGLLFYSRNDASYQVKVGLMTRLDREHQGLVAGYRAMPANVPEPLLLATYGPYQVLAARGMRHRPLLPLQGTADATVLIDGIDAFLATCRRAFHVEGRGRSWPILQQALDDAGARVGWDDRRVYWTGIRGWEARLPPVRQHGDFSANNLGIDGDRLVFFDWEDFGEVDLPGYDVAVLLLSLAGFSLWELAARLRSDSMEAAIVRRCCVTLGVSAAEFMHLFPAYAALYVQSKSMLGYPAKVTERLMAILGEWMLLYPSAAPAPGAALR